MTRRELSPSEALREASRLADGGRVSEAAQLYDAVLRRDPANKKARKALHALQRQGRLPLSRADFERVEELLRRERSEAARAEAERLCRVHPSQPALHNLLGVVLAHQGRRDEAVTCFRRALELEPRFDDALSNLASTLTARGDHREAVHCYQALVHRGRQDPDLYHSLASALRGAGLAEDALEACRRALRRRPLDPDILVTLGDTLNDLDRPEEAIEAYARALDIAPGNRRAGINLGRSCHATRRYPAAITAFARVLSTDPENVNALRGSARALLAIGQHHAASEQLQRLLRVDPADGVARHLLSALTGQTPPVADPAYARAVFEAEATAYDRHVAQNLRYRVPSQLPALLQGVDGENAWYDAALDLGCGTGLVGTQLRSYCSHLTGVDVSPAMLARATTTAVYDELVEADAVSWLRSTQRQFDLITAMDVLPYLGALDGLLMRVSEILLPGGRFLFTTEHFDGDGFVLRPTARYAHADAYVAGCVERAGLILNAHTDLRLRKERDGSGWIAGALFIASAPGS